MKKGKKNIDQVFSAKLRDFKAEPPVDVWEGVTGSLNQQKKRSRIVVFMRVAAVLAGLVALTVTALLVRDASTLRQVAVEQERTIETPSQKEVVIEEDIMDPEQIVPSVEGESTKQGNDIRIERENEFYTTDITEEMPENPVANQSSDFVEEEDEKDWLAYMTGLYLFSIPGDYGTVSDQPLRRAVPGDSPDPAPAVTKKKEHLAENMLDEDYSSAGKWGVGTNATPLYSYRNLGETGTMAASAQTYDPVESGTLAYAGGVHVNYIPGKRLSFQSGVYYSKMGINVDHNYYVTNLASPQDAASLALNYSRIRNSTGVIDAVGTDDAEFTYVSNESWDRAPDQNSVKINELNATIYEGDIIQNFEYLEIPMLVRYRLIDKKIGFNLLGGVSTNILVGSDAFYSENNSREKIGKTTNLKPVNYSSVVGLGLDYAITEKLLINLEPTFRYYMNSVNLSGLKSHPYSMGIFTGLSYYF